MDKKNNSNLIIIIVVIIALIVLIVIKNNTKKVTPEIIDENTAQLEEAIKYDKTTDIKTNIDNIKVEDTINADLDEVDKELNNL
jgi:hypothetical protein